MLFSEKGAAFFAYMRKIFDFALSANPKISEIKKQAFCLLFVVLYDRGIIFSPENGDIFQ